MGQAVFSVERRDRWRFRTPDGRDFLSIGVVHADDTNLRYPYNSDVFTARYGGSRRRWLHEGLVPEMRQWDEPYADLVDVMTEINHPAGR